MMKEDGASLRAACSKSAVPCSTETVALLTKTPGPRTSRLPSTSMVPLLRNTE